MRLSSLDLIAYGHFTERRIVFPQGKGLYVIYGPNEAGKSICIRAIRGLLYGIPENTADDFLHESKHLRVGGLLLRSDREKLSIIRRKGRKDTLLGPDGLPIREDTLRVFLGGIDRETFIRVFGMSRDELVSGGRAIMEGKGSIGESLFSAGLGGADLKSLLDAFEAEGTELFKPSGTIPKLNSGAKTYKDLKNKVRDLSLLPKDWEELESKVSALEEHSRQLKQHIAHLLAEEDHLKHLSDALPLIVEFKECRKKRADLGEVKILREGFPKERTDSQTEMAHAVLGEKAAEERTEEIDGELQDLIVPEDLLAQEKTVQGMVEELGGVLKAQKDLPRIQGQVLEASNAAKGILAELRPDLALDSARVLHLTVERVDRIRRLAEEYSNLLIRRQSTAEKIAEHTQELAEARNNLSELPVAKGISELERSLTVVRKRGDLESNYLAAKFEATLAREDAESALKRLPLWLGRLEDLECLPLPSDKTIDDFEKSLDSIGETLRKAQEALEETKTKIAEINSNLRTLKLAGEPPTENDLAVARGHRDRGWALVRSAWLDGKQDIAAEATYDPSLSLDQAYEKSVVNADAVADRMRREAERVAHKAGLLADLELNEQRAQDLSHEIRQLEGERSDLEKEWTSRWSLVGVIPLSPREMRAWVANWRDLVRWAAEIRKLNSQASKIMEQIEASRKDLLAQLVAIGESPPPKEATLEAIVLQSEDVIQSAQELQIKRIQLQKEIDEATKGKAKAEEGEKKEDKVFEQWEKNWTAAINGLSEDLPASAATVFIDKCSTLSKKLEEIEKDKSRIEGMRRDIKEFEDKVIGFIVRHAPDLTGNPVDQTVRDLASRVSKAKADVASRAKLSTERSVRKKDLEKAKGIILKMSGQLTALRREAGCETDDELPTMEKLSELARSLEERMIELTKQILILAAGRKMEEFAGEVEHEDPGRIKEELSKVQTDLSDAQEEFGRVRQDLGAASERLRKMDGRADAALAAQEAQETLVLLREDTERYLHIRLATKILRSEIERYREKAQGPVLKRAGELFKSLTQKRFLGLEPKYESSDEPVLVGIRENGEKVALTGMSDGTQDQLYLALRLSSLEKFINGGEPLPLLVDDALVNFDNDRVKAALKVLGDLGAGIQVILFTHHRHMMDLAMEAVDKRVLHTQELL